MGAFPNVEACFCTQGHSTIEGKVQKPTLSCVSAPAPQPRCLAESRAARRCPADLKILLKIQWPGRGDFAGLPVPLQQNNPIAMKSIVRILATAALALAVAACGNKKTAGQVEPENIPAPMTQTTPNPENAARAQQFLKACGTYYLATVEGDQPRVRPFGTAEIFEGRLYIQTGKAKNVFQQLLANPKAEICAFNGSQWIRIACELIPDERVEAKKDMLDKNPSLRGMYDENDDNTIVLYCRNAHATISSFTDTPETFAF